MSFMSLCINKYMKEETNINFTNTSGIGNVEDGVSRSEVSTITAVCKETEKALDASKQDKDITMTQVAIENNIKTIKVKISRY